MNYQSPEQLLGYPYLDYSVDMWGFGCILASWVFKRNIFFKNNKKINKKNQLKVIAKVILCYIDVTS